MDLNEVRYIGNVGKDCELADLGESRKVCKFPLAIKEKWKNAQGEPVEKTLWYNIVVFGKLAETCKEYVKKGSRVFVGGKSDQSEYVDKKDGVKKIWHSVVASNVIFLSNSRNAEETNQALSSSTQEAPKRPQGDNSSYGGTPYAKSKDKPTPREHLPPIPEYSSFSHEDLPF